jgi:hypothetical protein
MGSKCDKCYGEEKRDPETGLIYKILELKWNISKL